jgi:8-oxo-dGTP pyrophosphatase MutT (NUDIX family)
MGTSDGSPRANIFAAGSILWRRSPENDSAVEVALVHRPKYDDWSFPKGKLDPGETAVDAAVREVKEETGFDSTLGRSLSYVTYPIPGHRRMKKVLYWAAEATGGEFVPNDEVDELRWIAPDKIGGELSYPMDHKILRRFVAKPAATSTVLLVRHGSAGSRSRYKGNDADRPLDKTGSVRPRHSSHYWARSAVTRCMRPTASGANRLSRRLPNRWACRSNRSICCPRRGTPRTPERAATGLATSPRP